MTPDGRKQTVCLERYAIQVERELWPTPNARVKGGGEYQDPAKIAARWAKGRQRNLSEAVQMFPTPTRSMHKGSSAMTRSSGASRLNDRLDYAVEQGNIKDWTVEPAVGRVAHGVPDRVGQLRAYGNAVVPQIPELIGRAILASLEAA
jgi:hypothetical protein